MVEPRAVREFLRTKETEKMLEGRLSYAVIHASTAESVLLLTNWSIVVIRLFRNFPEELPIYFASHKIYDGST